MIKSPFIVLTGTGSHTLLLSLFGWLIDLIEEFQFALHIRVSKLPFIFGIFLHLTIDEALNAFKSDDFETIEVGLIWAFTLGNIMLVSFFILLLLIWELSIICCDSLTEELTKLFANDHFDLNHSLGGWNLSLNFANVDPLWSTISWKLTIVGIIIFFFDGSTGLKEKILLWSLTDVLLLIFFLLKIYLRFYINLKIKTLTKMNTNLDMINKKLIILWLIKTESSLHDILINSTVLLNI